MKVVDIEFDYDACPEIHRDLAILYYLLDIDATTITKINKEQSRNLRKRFNNLNTYGVSYNDDCIIIDSESGVRTWNYYAGFEYVDKEYVSRLQYNGTMISVYSAECERVNEIIEMLKELEESEGGE